MDDLAMVAYYILWDRQYENYSNRAKSRLIANTILKKVANKLHGKSHNCGAWAARQLRSLVRE